MIKGSIVALVTPMTADGAIHWDQLADLVEWHIASGSNALVAVGTTGESATLHKDEHLAVIKFITERVAKRIPVIAGAGGNSTAEAIELATASYHIGCDATLQVTPYYNKPPQRGLAAHYRAIAAAVPMPHILYNVPSRTGCDLKPETVRELATVANIIGIKEASNYERLEELSRTVPPGFLVYSGEDGLASRALVNGLIDGVISVTANVAPALMAALMANIGRAEALNERLAPLHETLFCESNPLPVKWALHRLGKIDPGIRLPLVPLAPEKQALVEAALYHAGLL